MSKLIKATAAAEVISENFNIPLIDLVDVMADIDWVEPIKGSWESEYALPPSQVGERLIYHRCSNCSTWSTRLAGSAPEKFCPNCGANMNRDLEKVKEAMCDDFCKYPSICDEEQLMARCEACPMNLLPEGE